jgi:hypothetical protein
MRIGANPMRERPVGAHKRHRVVMPVYIPSREGYFAHALELLRLSFASLLATTDPEHVSITVIDNASIPEVGELLAAAVASGRLDRLVRHAENRGKPDAVIAEVRASYERFVTLADCDVLFLPGWLAEVERVYSAWPRAGAVSPTAQPKHAFRSSTATWLHGLSRFQVRLGKWVSDDDMLQFARSVGNEAFYDPAELAAQFALCKGGARALVGAAHFVITLRRAAYDGFTYAPRREGTGRRSMRDLDEQVDRAGYLRLSTTRALALHLGNTPEPWMHQRFDAVASASAARLQPAGDPVLDQDLRRWPVVPLAGRRLLAVPIRLTARLWQKVHGRRGRAPAGAPAPIP